jgi:hypothetical protein
MKLDESRYELSTEQPIPMPTRTLRLPWPVSRYSIVAVLLLAGCASVTPINQLLNDPSRYDGKTVRIKGEVRGAVGGLGVGAYEVRDKTGRLTVVSDRGDPPRTGANVGVKGKFQALLSLGIKSIAVLREESRFDP